MLVFEPGMPHIEIPGKLPVRNFFFLPHLVKIPGGLGLGLVGVVVGVGAGVGVGVVDCWGWSWRLGRLGWFVIGNEQTQ